MWGLSREAMLGVSIKAGELAIFSSSTFFQVFTSNRPHFASYVYVRVNRACLVGRDAVGSERSRCAEKAIPAWLIPTPQVSLGRSVVAQHTGGSGAFVSANKRKDG